MASFKAVLIPTTDIAASRALYTGLLGAQPTADSEYYVGFDIEGQHIGLVPSATAVRPHLHVADLDTAVAQVTTAGGSVLEEPREVGGGRRVALVRDACGAELGLLADATSTA